MFKNSFILYRCFKKPLTYPLYLENRKHISQSYIQNSFYEKDRRGGYEYPSKIYPGDTDWKIHVREGRKLFIQNCKMFWEETKEHFRNDPKVYNDGDTDVFFRFDSEECLKEWRVGYDQMHNEGFSGCSLVINDKKKGVFSGNIDTTIPRDGNKKYTGYCGIKTFKKTKSFLREDHYNWAQFTHLEMRVKGDGRNYMINIGMGMYFDVAWFDTYTYTIFTHGGPYWQLIRIPFSKFYLQSKGRLQDKQSPIILHKVDSIGITAAGVPGPFQLEIDYIGCHLDRSHKEKFAYEKYVIPKELVST